MRINMQHRKERKAQFRKFEIEASLYIRRCLSMSEGKGRLVLCILVVSIAALLILPISSASLYHSDHGVISTPSTQLPAGLHVINSITEDNIQSHSQGPVVPHPPHTIVIVPIYNAYVSHNTTSSVTNNSVIFPTGSFSRITVTYFNQYISNPFDTSFVVLVDGIQIMSGNTLELENTSVTLNVTQYYSILQGKASVTVGTPQFNPGYSSRLSVWFTFYEGSEAPHPDRVISAFSDINFPTPRNAFPFNVPIPFNVSRTTTVTLPQNITSAYLNLYEQQNGNDEFWYTLQPPFREFRIYIDGVLVGTVQPYPNIQTGGGDLFLWQPILAIGAELYPPHVISLTPYLSMLPGKHTVTIQVINDENLWIRVALNFMLNTSEFPGTGALVQQSFTFNNSYVQTPPTNETTESIPLSASYLNDSEYVTEQLSSSGTFIHSGVIIYSQNEQSVNFFANATEFDPSFDITGNTPAGFGTVSYENFYLREYINQTQMTLYQYSGYSEKVLSIIDSYYQINGTAITDLAFSPLQIVIGFNVTQIREIRAITSTTIYMGGLTPVTEMSINISNTMVNGTGMFIGTLNSESEITSLSYNHAFTQKLVEDASFGSDGATHYLLFEQAVNDSLVQRNGVLITYIVRES